MRLALLLSLLLHALLLAALASTLWPPLAPSVPFVLELRLDAAGAGAKTEGHAAGAQPQLAQAASRPPATVRPTPAAMPSKRATLAATAVLSPEQARPQDAVAAVAAAAPAPAPAATTGTAPAAATVGASAMPGSTTSPSGTAAGGSGETHKARLLSAPRPQYPPLSRELNEAGVVWLRLTVDTQGAVSDVALLRSSGFRRLDKAAMTAVWQWRFQPQQEGGKVVVAEVEQPVRFNLQESE
ncbi:energy transducer TonB [Vogesella oryzae]|uniref:energy transducer TonB n=1 Tax=Vogesella oryzae TaxID=1735285 RepID=UPI00158177B9|nr:energy transducer TonB [Vogesella oryzae]